MMPKKIAVAVFGGAFGGFFVYLIVNSMVLVNGVGMVELYLPEPLSSIWTWASGGAVFSLIGLVIGLVLRARRGAVLRDWGERHGFEFHENIGRDKLGSAQTLDVFHNWHAGHNHMVGRIGESAIEMVDFTSVFRGSETHLSWCVESQSGHLAIWKPDTIVPASGRKRLLETVDEMREALLLVKDRQPTPGLELQFALPDRRNMTKSLIRFVVCIFAGFFLGGFRTVEMCLTGDSPKGLECNDVRKSVCTSSFWDPVFTSSLTVFLSCYWVWTGLACE